MTCISAPTETNRLRLLCFSETLTWQTRRTADPTVSLLPNKNNESLKIAWLEVESPWGLAPAAKLVAWREFAKESQRCLVVNLAQMRVSVCQNWNLTRQRQ